MKRQIFPNPQAVAEVAAQQAVAALQAAIETYGNATWVVAGGSTPMAAYAVLVDQYLDALDWSKVTVVIGDERCVPLDDPESNWRQIATVLLDQLPLSVESVRPLAEQGALAAESYERHLRSLPLNDAGLPRLDHVWLGMGPDGHTLSIFPGHPSLAEAAGDKLVIFVDDSPKPPPQRISLSFLALTAAHSCLVLVSGEAKAPVMARIAEGDESLPVARAVATVETAGGEVLWLLDQAAAGSTATA